MGAQFLRIPQTNCSLIRADMEVPLPEKGFSEAMNRLVCLDKGVDVCH